MGVIGRHDLTKKKDNDKDKDHDKHMNLCEIVDISDSWEPEFTPVIQGGQWGLEN